MGEIYDITHVVASGRQTFVSQLNEAVSAYQVQNLKVEAQYADSSAGFSALVIARKTA